MIRLSKGRAAGEPYWIELWPEGPRLKVRPLTSAMVLGARFAAGGAEAAPGERTAAFVKALARVAIVDWEGIAAEDGAPAPVEPDAIDAAFDLWQIAERFQDKYLAAEESLGLVVAEKNA
ncbi:MAG: hypothetical protein AB7N54_15160 [Alphaproteobacteria bacterium]